MEEEDTAISKRQRIVTLTPREHILQRPEMYVGPLATTEHMLPEFGQLSTASTLTASPALISLTNELVNLIVASRRFNTLTLRQREVIERLKSPLSLEHLPDWVLDL